MACVVVSLISLPRVELIVFFIVAERAAQVEFGTFSAEYRN